MTVGRSSVRETFLTRFLHNAIITSSMEWKSSKNRTILFALFVISNKDVQRGCTANRQGHAAFASVVEFASAGFCFW